MATWQAKDKSALHTLRNIFDMYLVFRSLFGGILRDFELILQVLKHHLIADNQRKVRQQHIGPWETASEPRAASGA